MVIDHVASLVEKAVCRKQKGRSLCLIDIGQDALMCSIPMHRQVQAGGYASAVHAKALPDL